MNTHKNGFIVSINYGYVEDSTPGGFSLTILEPTSFGKGFCKWLNHMWNRSLPSYRHHRFLDKIKFDKHPEKAWDALSGKERWLLKDYVAEYGLVPDDDDWECLIEDFKEALERIPITGWDALSDYTEFGLDEEWFTFDPPLYRCSSDYSIQALGRFIENEWSPGMEDFNFEGTYYFSQTSYSYDAKIIKDLTTLVPVETNQRLYQILLGELPWDVHLDVGVDIGYYT